MHVDELADGSGLRDEPRGVVVAVAAARPVDEHDVLTADLRAPVREARPVRRRPQPRAPLLLRLRRNGVLGRGSGAGTRRVGEDVHLRQARLRDDVQRVPERALVLGREADDDVAREVEVVLQRLEPAEVGGDGVAAAHRAQHRVIAGLERDMQVTARDRRLTERADELVVDVVDLDRGEAQPLEPGGRACLSDEPREAKAGGAVAVAAEVDPGEDDLAVALRNAAADLAEHGFGRAAA